MLVGNREILSSGSIVTQHGDSTIAFSHGELTFKIVFKVGEGEAKATAEGEGNNITIILNNFDNAIGAAWFSEVGTSDKGKLFLALHGQALGGEDKIVRLLSYTLSLQRGD